MTRKLLRPVYLEWIDSRTDAVEWVMAGEIKEPGPILIRSVGFILRENDEAISLAQNDGGDQYCHIIVIPKVTVKKRKLLKGY